MRFNHKRASDTPLSQLNTPVKPELRSARSKRSKQPIEIDGIEIGGMQTASQTGGVETTPALHRRLERDGIETRLLVEYRSES